MDPRTRTFLWVGMAVLAALSLRPAGEVLAADLRGSSLESSDPAPRSQVVRADRGAAEEDAAATPPESSERTRRS